LLSGGAGLRSLDLCSLNETLARHKLRLRAVMTPSERIVNCRVNGNQWRGRTVFTLESAAPGVEPEPDEPEDAGALVLPEASADGQASAI